MLRGFCRLVGRTRARPLEKTLPTRKMCQFVAKVDWWSMQKMVLNHNASFNTGYPILNVRALLHVTPRSNDLGLSLHLERAL